MIYIENLFQKNNYFCAIQIFNEDENQSKH